MQAEIVDLAHQTRDARAFETRVLELFERTVGFDVAFFLVKGLEASPTVSGLPSATVERAIQGGAIYSEELMPVKRAALAKRGVAVDTEVLGALGVQKTRYYTDIVVRAARAELDDVRLLPVIGANERFAADALRNVVVIATRTR